MMIKENIGRILVSILLLTFLTIPNAALAADLLVPSIHSTISSAITAAQTGDRVLVSSGTYNETIDFGGKAITVESVSGARLTFIAGDRSGSIVTFASSETATSVLNGFTIHGGEAANGGGINCTGSSPTIKNCIITDNSQFDIGNGAGIYIKTGSPTITNCAIVDNEAVYGRGGGIYCDNASPTFTNCTIANNETLSYGAAGISAENSSAPVLLNCILFDNTFEGGVSETYADGTSSITATYSDIESAFAPYPGAGNISSDPLFKDGTNVTKLLRDYRITSLSPCKETGTATGAPTDDFEGHLRPHYSLHDIGFDERVREVAIDAVIEYGTIQAAIDAALPGETVLVMSGTYSEILTLSKAITVISERGAASTIIDGFNQNSSVVTIGGAVTSTTVLDGFTIQNGTGTISGPDTVGGGIYINGGAPLVKNCIITGNRADFGAGVFNTNSLSPPVFTDCTITANTGYKYGGGVCAYTAITLTNCSITSNTLSIIINAYGAAIFSMGLDLTLNNCKISENTSSGATGSNAAGTIYFTGNTMNMTNCVVVDNTLGGENTHGGGIYASTATAVNITNCTIANNTLTGVASGFGGGIRSINSTVTLINSILWNNTAATNGNEIVIDGSSTVTVDYSDIDPADVLGTYTDGGNNVNSDPLFADDTNATKSLRNYNLRATSVCIDSATSIGAPAEDYDGTARPGGNGYDMGAYEWAPVYFESVAGDSAITLYWAANILTPAATGYKVYIGDSPGVYNIDNGVDIGATTTYTKSSLTNGTTYYVKVTYYDFDVIEYPHTAEIYTTPYAATTTTSDAYVGGPNNYKMMAFPFDFSQGNSDPVDILVPFFDPSQALVEPPYIYDSSVWRIYGYDNPNNVYVQPPDDPTGWHTDLWAGCGYWVVSLNDADLSLTGNSVDTSKDYLVQDLPPGWNMVGNPFNFPVDVSGIKVTDGAGTFFLEDGVLTLATVYHWEGAYVTKSQFLPNRAYWVKNTTTDPPRNITVLIPPVVAPLTAPPRFAGGVVADPNDMPPAPPVAKEPEKDGLCFIATASYEDAKQPTIIEWIVDMVK